MTSRGFDVSGALTVISAILLDINFPPKGYKAIFIPYPNPLPQFLTPERRFRDADSDRICNVTYQSRRVGFEQLDDGIGCIFVRTVRLFIASQALHVLATL